MRKPLYLHFLCFALTAGMALTACANKNDFDRDSIYSSAYGTIAVDSLASMQIVCDDTTILQPSNLDCILRTYTPVEGQRVAVHYLPDEVAATGSGEVSANIRKLQNILTSDMYATADPDTLSDYPMDPLRIWVSGNVLRGTKFLNVRYFVYTDNPFTYKIKLVEDLSDNALTDEGLLPCQLRFITGGAVGRYAYSSIISFVLPREVCAPEVKGLYLKINTRNYGLAYYKVKYL